MFKPTGFRFKWCFYMSKPHEKDIFGISAAGVELSRTRKKLVATASRA